MRRTEVLENEATAVQVDENRGGGGLGRGEGWLGWSIRRKLYHNLFATVELQKYFSTQALSVFK